VSYPKLPTCLGHFEFKTIRSPTGSPPSEETTEKNILSSGYAGGPTIFLRRRLRERKSREISPTEIISLTCPSTRFLEYPAGKSCSSFRPWRLRSSDILCCYEFQPTYHKSNWVTLTYAQRPRLVWPSVRVLGKPSLERGRVDSASDWQDGIECVCKHLKSS
jgi:hypothetical protein